MGNVEVWLDANGDFVQTENGDLQLAVDTPYEATATMQRIGRLLTTSPRSTDASGAPIAPGDIFNPTYGAGEPQLVDQPITASFMAALQARILNGLLSDPTIAQVPTPTVVVTQVGTTTVQVSIIAKTVTGAPVIIPSLVIGGGQVGTEVSAS